MNKLALGFGFLWIVMATVVMVFGDDPLSTNDLVRFYGMSCIGHIWFGISVVVSEIKIASI